jgi:hypothetical protein
MMQVRAWVFTQILREPQGQAMCLRVEGCAWGPGATSTNAGLLGLDGCQPGEGAGGDGAELELVCGDL